MNETAWRRRVERRLADRWQTWGYREVSPPVWAPWDDVALGAADLPLEAWKFLDPQGRLLTLRPDNTLALARLAATDLVAEPRPLRLYYRNDVFRRLGGTGGVEAVPQAGLELIGGGDARADAEVLALATESLVDLGLGEFRLSVGHVDLLRRVLEGAGMPPSARVAVMAALQDRDHVALEKAVAAAQGVTAEQRAELFRCLTMPVRAGEREVVARWLEKWPGGRQSWADLEAVLSLAGLYGLEGYILIEPGLVLDLDYYSGLVFEISVPGLARPLGGGGRYDGLLGRFGAAEPATGFAFELMELIAAMRAGDISPGVRRPTCLVAACNGRQQEAWMEARRLREVGVEAEVDASDRSREELIEYGRRRGMDTLRLFTDDGPEEIALSTGSHPEGGPGDGGATVDAGAGGAAMIPTARGKRGKAE